MKALNHQYGSSWFLFPGSTSLGVSKVSFPFLFCNWPVTRQKVSNNTCSQWFHLDYRGFLFLVYDLIYVCFPPLHCLVRFQVLPRFIYEEEEGELSFFWVVWLKYSEGYCESLVIREVIWPAIMGWLFMVFRVSLYLTAVSPGLCLVMTAADGFNLKVKKIAGRKERLNKSLVGPSFELVSISSTLSLYMRKACDLELIRYTFFCLTFTKVHLLFLQPTNLFLPPFRQCVNETDTICRIKFQYMEDAVRFVLGLVWLRFSYKMSWRTNFFRNDWARPVVNGGIGFIWIFAFRKNNQRTSVFGCPLLLLLELSFFMVLLSYCNVCASSVGPQWESYNFSHWYIWIQTILLLNMIGQISWFHPIWRIGFQSLFTLDSTESFCQISFNEYFKLEL